MKVSICRLSLFLLLVLNANLLVAQVTKLPTYAIQIQYYIDQYKPGLSFDTVGNMRWVDTNSYANSDSILYQYNSKGQLVMEQIFRTGIFAKPNVVYAKAYPDTSRYFRQHVYDAKGRKVAIRHGEVFGSPHGGNWRNWTPYPKGGPRYFSFIMRLDSFAYDSQDKQIFYRRYDVFDFNNKDFRLVLKNTWGRGYTWEKEYEYDNLGRVTKESYIWWVNQVKTLIPFGNIPRFGGEFYYKYYGNTNKMSSRGHYENRFEFGRVFIKDSLFTYDAKGRQVGAGNFGEPIKDGSGNVTMDYTKPIAGFYDSTIYFDDNGSYQKHFYFGCQGRKFYPDGRPFYSFGDGRSAALNLCGTYDGSPRGVGDVNHYTFDIDGNILARDSLYYNDVFPSGSLSDNGNTYLTYFAFDTIAYYGFKNISEVTGINDHFESEIDSKWSLFPNPAENSVYVQNAKQGILNIYNVEGTKLFQQEIKAGIREVIDISLYPSGIYIMELNESRKKLIVR